MIDERQPASSVQWTVTESPFIFQTVDWLLIALPREDPNLGEEVDRTRLAR